MKHEGILRSAVWVGDEYKTVSVYSILYGEYIRSEIQKGYKNNMP